MSSDHTSFSHWSIRPYHPGDEHELVALFRRAFGHSITPVHWLWKFKALPSPVENVWLAVANDRPISQCAAMPIRYHLHGEHKIVMVNVDVMTAPDFRRQGLLTNVGRFAYDTWRETDIPFVIGLPNDKWGSRTVALGWQRLFPLQWLARPLHLETILARRFRLPALAQLNVLGSLWHSFWEHRAPSDATIQIHHVEQAGPEFDTLWQTCSTETQISAVRDSAWVNWRYLSTPTLNYRVLLAKRASEPVGYIAYRLQKANGRKLGFIAELLTQRVESKGRHTLVKQAINDLKAKGAETAFTLAVPNTWLHRAFRRAGFVFRRASFGVQFVPLDPNLPLNIFRNPQNWIMAGGDFDVI